jgi:hypothetical protein
VARATLVANPKTTPYDYFFRSPKASAPSLAIELVPSYVETADDIERAIVTFVRVPDGGLNLPPDSTISRSWGRFWHMAGVFGDAARSVRCLRLCRRSQRVVPLSVRDHELQAPPYRSAQCLIRNSAPGSFRTACPP